MRSRLTKARGAPGTTFDGATGSTEPIAVGVSEGTEVAIVAACVNASDQAVAVRSGVAHGLGVPGAGGVALSGFQLILTDMLPQPDRKMENRQSK
jgi:hypothetical protein